MSKNPSYCFKWNDYQNYLPNLARQLLAEDSMVDVILVAEGERIHAHRIILCSCSTLFQELLTQVNEDHPTVILCDISAEDIKAIIEFIYRGEVRVPVQNIGSLLKAARSLKIYGLIEIEGLEENESAHESKELMELPEDIIAELQNNESSDFTEESNNPQSKGDNSVENESKCIDEEESNIHDESSLKKRKRRKDSIKKDYSEDSLSSAIDDLRQGQTLLEASTKHKVPRSTLYMRAKALGIRLNATRHEYAPENIKGAINAVMEGSSLQQASEKFCIPKTVLWRRIQKEGYQILRTEIKKSYGADKREAAVKALERGENLTKVALEFQIPKTTLFRDKARLVSQGKLPWSFWKKRTSENEKLKRSRLEEAVVACRSGKMSQAAASIFYRIPKTTIWRRLQQDDKHFNRSINSKKNESAIIKDETDKSEDPNDVSYCEISSEIPITYINENNLPEDSVIILTTDDMEGLNLEGGRHIIVNSESGEEYVPCTISIENETGYPQAES